LPDTADPIMVQSGRQPVGVGKVDLGDDRQGLPPATPRLAATG
jgi:hypothetical protein